MPQGLGGFGGTSLTSNTFRQTLVKLRRGRGLLRFLLVLAALVTATPATASLRGSLGRALGSSGVPAPAMGALAVDLRNGGVAYALNPGRAFKPASNQKLLVAAAALERLGPAFRIRTEVLGEGALDGSVWRGRIVLRGRGDPTLSSADLRTLAARLRAAGIARISGRIVGDESYFDKRRTARGWKPWYYKVESPPLSALVVNAARTRGRIVDNPALAAAVAFRGALRQAGIRVPARAVTGVAQPGAVQLARVSSRRLWRLVRRMNKTSDNFVAESLLKKLGAVVRGRGTTRAGAVVVRSVLEARGVPLAGVRIVDGSGLSEYDRLTARSLAALLIYAWSDPSVRRYFVASLPIAGVDGTLEDRMLRQPARGDVRAKTGTTSSSSALSGYAGARYVFSVLMNGSPIPLWNARLGQDRFAQVLTRAALQ